MFKRFSYSFIELLIIVAILGCLATILAPEKSAFAQSVPLGSIPTYTSATVTVTNASTTILAANRVRKYLLVQNNDSTGSIFITTGSTAATTALGIKLLPGQTWTPRAPSVEAINAIGSIASNGNVIVVEGQ